MVPAPPLRELYIIWCYLRRKYISETLHAKFQVTFVSFDLPTHGTSWWWTNNCLPQIRLKHLHWWYALSHARDFRFWPMDEIEGVRACSWGIVLREKIKMCTYMWNWQFPAAVHVWAIYCLYCSGFNTPSNSYPAEKMGRVAWPHSQSVTCIWPSQQALCPLPNASYFAAKNQNFDPPWVSTRALL